MNFGKMFDDTSSAWRASRFVGGLRVSEIIVVIAPRQKNESIGIEYAGGVCVRRKWEEGPRPFYDSIPGG